MAESWEQRGERQARVVLLLIILGLVMFLGRRQLQSLVYPVSRYDPDATLKPIVARGDLAADEASTVELFERVSPSVVFVTTLARGYRRGIFFFDGGEHLEGTGSGFVWNKDGYIVTNFHVIRNVYDGRSSCRVMLKDLPEPFDAEVIGVAPDQDVAVLKITAPPEQLSPIEVGDSNNIKVGQKAFAIGNPFGLELTLTSGIVSALNREIRAITGHPIEGVIQTDTAINFGNSGGPLLDSAGLLIGVTTAIRKDAANIGFAIPADAVNKVVTQLIRDGGAREGGPRKPALGVSLLRRDIATKQAGIHRGVVIKEVQPNGAADSAGLQGLVLSRNGMAYAIGDIILAIDGKEVNSPDEVKAEIEKRAVGDTITLSIQRGDTLREVQVRLQPQVSF